MRLVKPISLSLALLFIAHLSFGQRLLVQYDYLNDDFKYYKVYKNGNRKALDRAVVTRSHNVKVEVVNYNPFVYSAMASYSTKEYTESPNFNFLNLISPLNLPTGGSAFLSTIAGTNADGTRAADATDRKGGIWDKADAKAAFEAVEKTYTALYQAEQMMNEIDFVLNKVHKLKYNPYLPGDSIKSFTQTLLDGLFGDQPVESKSFMEMSNTINRSVKSNLVVFKSDIRSFLSEYEDHKRTQAGRAFKGEGLDQLVRMWEKQAENFIDGFDSDLLIEKLDVLEIEYQSIMNTPFVFNTNDVAEGDELTIVIDFYKNPSEGDGVTTDIENLPKIKSKEIDVTVKGDIKISSSLGVSFPYYADNQDFINRDSVITSVDGNNFTPNVSAFLNFYPYNGKNVQVGGTFGVGVPISADSKNFNFLMGMSTIFGSNNKIVVNFGPTLGQVNKLDQGYVVGENLGDLTSAVPTRKAYQWGGFVGVSFTLANIKE